MEKERKARTKNDDDFFLSFLTEESETQIEIIKKALRMLQVIALIDKNLPPYELKHFTTNFLKSLERK